MCRKHLNVICVFDVNLREKKVLVVICNLLRIKQGSVHLNYQKVNKKGKKDSYLSLDYFWIKILELCTVKCKLYLRKKSKRKKKVCHSPTV